MISVLLMVATLSIGDRCHQLYTEINREIDKQRAALAIIDKCYTVGVQCRRSEIDPAIVCAFGEQPLTQMIEEMTELTKKDPTCKERFGPSINKEVNELLSESTRLAEKLSK